MIEKKININELKKLNLELNKLKNKKIPKIIKEIKKSKLLGDLSENSEYYYAKRKKFILDKKIKDIETLLSESKILNEKNKDLIKIKLENIKNHKILEYNFNKNNNNSTYSVFKDKNINDLIKIKKYNKEITFKIISID